MPEKETPVAAIAEAGEEVISIQYLQFYDTQCNIVNIMIWGIVGT